MNAQHRQKVYERRAKLKASGLCICCGKPRKPDNKNYCDQCRIDQNERIAKWAKAHPLTEAQREKRRIYNRDYKRRQREQIIP